jgi:L-aspartate oxidase
MKKDFQFDFLIIGSGLAGLSFALKVCKLGTVAVVTKDAAISTNTQWAQGGIAAVMSEEDSFQNHTNDTMRAGAGLCHRDIVENYVEQAPHRIQDLLDWGVKFDFDPKNHQIDLTKEGGHDFRRILHIEDHTGGEIHKAVLKKVLEEKNIQIFENHYAVDLILNKHIQRFSIEPKACVGAYVLDQKKNQVLAFKARHTVLASGGAGRVYLYTSNWKGATGDGIAMAYRAGARVANLEFMQFHPTCLFHADARNFLISEALRGEGAELVNSNGEAFMRKCHPMGSLAPRDIVARCIDSEIKKTGARSVFLDATHLGKSFLQERFPVIFNRCQQLGIDISKDPIPVVPAAHYLCGGVLTDKNGFTDIQGLYALGETSCTGFHGANRLASNSLLECLCMAHNCAQSIEASSLHFSDLSIPQWVSPQATDPDEIAVIHHMWDEVRTLMWNYVGIVRTNKRLDRAHHRLKIILEEVRDYYDNMKVHPNILELRNIALVAYLTVECARRRKESRGIHFNQDYPAAQWQSDDFENKKAFDTILT